MLHDTPQLPLIAHCTAAICGKDYLAWHFQSLSSML
jgi:hypothetical protein